MMQQVRKALLHCALGCKLKSTAAAVTIVRSNSSNRHILLSPGGFMQRTAHGMLVALLLPAAALGQEPARVYDVDAAQSHIFLVTHRSGLFSFLGHEHAVLATEQSAELCLSADAPSQSALRISIPTRSLVIDSDSARALARLGGGPNAEQRAEITRKMMDERRLHADVHPTLSFQTVSVQRIRTDSLQVQGRLRIRGVERDVRFPARLTRTDANAVRLQAKLRFKLSDFGVLAETVAGVVKVANDVDLYVDLRARPTPQECDGERNVLAANGV
jgi:polyisoprenoid-binding protein YceI